MAQVWSLRRIWAFGQARDKREEEKGERIEKRGRSGGQGKERKRRGKVKLNYEFCQEIQYCYHSVLAT